MKKILNNMLVLLCLIVSYAFCGCNQNASDNPSVTTEETTRLYDKQINISDDINNYKIQYNEEESLKISVTTHIKLNKIKNKLNSLLLRSSIQPMISDVESIAHIEQLREISIENERQYYCIFSDENENKLYLFFDEFGDNHWRCYCYYDYIDKENSLSTYVNSLDK